jgi:hypothetical protein
VAATKPTRIEKHLNIVQLTVTLSFLVSFDGQPVSKIESLLSVPWLFVLYAVRKRECPSMLRSRIGF